MTKAKSVKGRTCGECIHESACQTWSANAYIHNTKTNCANYETVRNSNAYLIGFMEGKKEIVHACWREENLGFVSLYRCSKCGSKDGAYERDDFKYCPDGGAKMDGKESNV